MKKYRSKCARHMAPQRDMSPTPLHLAVMRRAITAAAAGYGWRLPPESVEDLMQDVFLELWKSKAHDKLDYPPYVRRVAVNTVIDALRRQNARKRTLPRALAFDLVRTLWRPPRTPEDIVIAREEAYGLLARNSTVRKRVERAMRQYITATTQENVRCTNGKRLIGLYGQPSSQSLRTPAA